MSRQIANGIKNAIKEYSAFILALIIVPAFIIFLIIQTLQEMFKQTEARIDNLERSKEKQIPTSQAFNLF